MFTYHSKGQFYFVYIVPLGLINIFLHVEHDKNSCGLPTNTFFPKFFIKLYYC